MAEPVQFDRDQFSQIIDVLLTPREDVVLTDVRGETYPLPGALSARCQFAVLREIGLLAQMPVGDGALSDRLGGLLSSWGSTSDEDGLDPAETGADLLATAGGLLLELVNEDGVLDGLERAFLAAHPDLLPLPPADLLPVEEIVGGLVPFFVRPIRRWIGTFLPALRATESKAA